MSAESPPTPGRCHPVFRVLPALVLLLLLGACGDDDPGPATVPPRDITKRLGDHPRSAYLINEDCFEAARAPMFVDASDATFLSTDDAVLGVRVHDRVVAVPLRWIAYHRLVQVDDVLVTYAPLDGEAKAYRLAPADTKHGFGIAGHLVRDLLLYDARQRSYWLQKSGLCIAGWRKGEQLGTGPGVTWSTWAAWQREHPETSAMAPDPAMADRYPVRDRDWRTPLPTPPGLRRVPVSSDAVSMATWLTPDPPPTIDDPTWISADEATYVRDDDDVIGFAAPEPVAVPVYVLAHHHAINARFKDRRVVITVCDLCSTAAVYEASLDGAPLTFDLVGAYRGAALFSDRQTRSRWQILTGTCVFGWHYGVKLRSLGAVWTTWRAWRREHPDTSVLAERPVPDSVLKLRDDRLRGQPGLPGPMAHTLPRGDPRKQPQDLVLGVEVGGPRAYAYDDLRKAGGVAHHADSDVVVLFDPSSRTARAYRPVIEGGTERVRIVRRTPEGRFEDETGRSWSLGGVAGTAVLPAVPAVQAEWYAWSAAHPDTELWTPPK